MKMELQKFSFQGQIIINYEDGDLTEEMVNKITQDNSEDY